MWALWKISFYVSCHKNVQGFPKKNILENYLRNLREENQELKQQNESLKSKISAARKFEKGSDAENKKYEDKKWSSVKFRNCESDIFYFLKKMKEF